MHVGGTSLLLLVVLILIKGIHQPLTLDGYPLRQNWSATLYNIFTQAPSRPMAQAPHPTAPPNSPLPKPPGPG